MLAGIPGNGKIIQTFYLSFSDLRSISLAHRFMFIFNRFMNSPPLPGRCRGRLLPQSKELGLQINITGLIPGSFFVIIAFCCCASESVYMWGLSAIKVLLEFDRLEPRLSQTFTLHL